MDRPCLLRGIGNAAGEGRASRMIPPIGPGGKPLGIEAVLRMGDGVHRDSRKSTGLRSLSVHVVALRYRGLALVEHRDSPESTE